MSFDPLEPRDLPALLAALRHSSFDHLELTDGARRLRVRQPKTVSASPPPSPPPVDRPEVRAPVVPEGHLVATAWRVGRFYSTHSSDNVQPVRVGDRVRKGQKICMIEAMGVEHEVEAAEDGILVRVFPDDGDAVMYGQPLFVIDRTRTSAVAADGGA